MSNRKKATSKSEFNLKSFQSSEKDIITNGHSRNISLGINNVLNKKIKETNNNILEMQFKKDKMARVEGDNFKFDIDNINFNNKQGSSNISRMSGQSFINETTKVNLMSGTEKNIIKNLLKETTNNRDNNQHNQDEATILKSKSRLNSKKQLKKVSQIPITQDNYNVWGDELSKTKYDTPGLTDMEDDQEEFKDEFKFIENIKKSEEFNCDNDYDTNEYFIKLKVIESNTALYHFISISSGVMYHELKTYPENFTSVINNIDLYNTSLNFLLILVSVGVLFFSKNNFILIQ